MSIIRFYNAHGSGAGHTSSDFLLELAKQVSTLYCLDYMLVTFDYMKQQEATGKKRPPSKFATLVEEYTEQIGSEHLAIVAGKSLGGRVATQLSNFKNVKAIVCFGFPFHPPGRPEKHRLSFLDKVQCPCLVFQGTRDAFGRPEWVQGQSINKMVEIHWVEGADHDFKTLKKMGLSREQTIQNIVEVMRRWLEKHELV